MKKFIWRLQRLLDIKMKQEESMRAELVAITEQAVLLQGRIMMQKTILRRMLAEMEEKEGSQRLAEQEFFFKYAHISDERIKQLEEQLVEVEKLRRKKIKELMKIRKYRKALEKLRESAKAEYLTEQNAREQKDLDEKTIMSIAREIIQQS